MEAALFEIFKSKRSLARILIERQLYTRGTWFEWTLVDGRRETTLVVQVEYELDPNAPNFFPEGIDEISEALAEAAKVETPPHRVRVIPCV